MELSVVNNDTTVAISGDIAASSDQNFGAVLALADNPSLSLLGVWQGLTPEGRVGQIKDGMLEVNCVTLPAVGDKLYVSDTQKGKATNIKPAIPHYIGSVISRTSTHHNKHKATVVFSTQPTVSPNESTGEISVTQSQVVDLIADLGNKQPADATLTALANLSASSGLLEQTGEDTFTKRSIGVESASDIPTRGDADSRFVATGDPRLSDARTPTAHTQASSTISDSTVVGRGLLTANNAATAFSNIKQAASTTVTGVVELATDGEVAANLAVQANDSRLSDARAPVAHDHAAEAITSGVLSPARLGTGEALQTVRRNAANDALEFYTPASSGSVGSEIVLPSNNTPTTPSVDKLNIHARNTAGKMFLNTVDSDGFASQLQTHLTTTKFCLYSAAGNSTTAPVALGGAALTAVGTATARSVAITNFVTQMRRLGYVSAATVGALCGARIALLQYWRGNAAKMGGFLMSVNFAVSDAATVAGARMFVGFMSSSAAPANVEPNTLNNSVGLAKLSTSDNLHIVCRNATTSTAIDLGVDFPAHTRSADAYRFWLYCKPNGTDISYRVLRLNTGHVAEGALTANLPVNTQLLAFQMWRCNNATALAVALDFVSLYIEESYL